MSAASCGCPEDDGLVRHQRGLCTDPAVARLGWYFEPAESAPQCPPWCTKDHGKDCGVASGVHFTQFSWPRDYGGPSVSLHQAPQGAPALYFAGVRIDPLDAGLLASAMRRLGHPDVAAAIAEMAALADGSDRGSEQ
jgi:hypothetical protein